MKLMIAAVAAGCLMMAACATDEHKREVEFFNDGNEFFAKNRFEPSQKAYQRLLDEAPDSPFRVHALLGSADAYYMDKEYIAAAPVYARFVELYPQDELTPRALFYEGMSYYQDMVPMKKDQTSAQKALNVFREFAKKYPTHFATPFVAEKIAELDDRLMEKEYDVALFYFNTSAYVSCIDRVDYLVEHWPHGRLNANALLLKGKSYLAEEAFDKAKDVFKKVAADYPSSPAGAEAAALVAAKP